MRKHRHVIDTARDVVSLYGYEEMATPIFEFADVFTRPLGESSDVVSKETYNLTDRGGEQLTLRPENTAGVVRAMISNGLTQSLPLKYFYAGPMFRYERPQKGRMRQFHQIGIECLGPEIGITDAEIIICGARLLQRLGVHRHCKLHVNTLGDAKSRSDYRKALVEYMKKHKSKLSEDSLRRLDINPLRILDSKDEGDREVVKYAPRAANYLTVEAVARFNTTLKALDFHELEWTLDGHLSRENVVGGPEDHEESTNIMKWAGAMHWQRDDRLVRGLDYYCHTAFEFVTDSLGAQGTVLGGGRYDGLAEMLGCKTPVAGVGWAAGIERLAMLINDVEAIVPDIAVLPMDEEQRSYAVRVAETLRDQGFRVDMQVDGAIGKRLKRINRAGIRLAAIVGSDEKEATAVQLRDMTEGDQEEIAVKDLGAKTHERVGNHRAERKAKVSS